MTKLDFFWATNREWWHFENHVIVLNDDAPPEAQESYANYLRQCREEYTA